MPNASPHFEFLLFDGFSNLVLASAMEPLRDAKKRSFGAESLHWSISTIDGSPVTNQNHAEQGLFSYFQDNYSGQNANISIAVQNNSITNPGMCQGCYTTSQNFAGYNSNFSVNIYEGSSGTTP